MSESDITETPSAQGKSLKQAKKDYIANPVPSTSKGILAKSTNFKKPVGKSPSKPKSSSSSSPNKVIGQQKSFQFDSDTIEDDNLSTVSTASRTPYSRSEEQKIVEWIAKNKQYSGVGGNQIWRMMEQDNAVPGRTSQSMKERFRKKILPQIDLFKLSEDDKNAFKKLRAIKKRRLE